METDIKKERPKRVLREKFITKPWGTDELIFCNNVSSLHRIDIKEGGVSSNGEMHFHKHKHNLIYVECGILKLYVQSSQKGILEFVLDPETQYTKYTIFPQIRHRFAAITEVIAYEYYYTYCDLNDIVRL